MVGEAGDFKCLRDPPQALCFTEAGAFLLAHTADYILGLGSSGATGRGWAQRGFGWARHDQLTNAALAARFGSRRYTKSERKPRW